MTAYTVDLHVHTILSPCAEVEMIPPFIVEKAVQSGLDMIAITDHNSAENVSAVIEAAEGTALKVIPGIECESVEGVHLVCLFDETDAVMEMQELIYSKLPNLQNKPDVFGAQFVVDSIGEFVRYNERLLLVPVNLTIEEIADYADKLGGLVIPAHIDRPSYGIYGVLGFLPEQPEFKIVEISRHLKPEEAVLRYPDLKGKRLLNCSDAHRLEELGTCRTMLDLKRRTVAAIRQMA